MRLVEQGKVRLDNDLLMYVTNFPLQGHHVSIRQLLMHTSGIHDYTDKDEWRPHWAEDLTPDSIVGFVARDSFDFVPGTKWSYGNTGYVLLRMVIERASGKSYSTYLDEQFFKPLGLKNTCYCPSHAPDTTFASGYSIHNGALVPSVYLSLTQPFSAGALCSTARDFLVPQRALHGGGIVNDQSYALMTTRGALTDGTSFPYGFGLGVRNFSGHRLLFHAGGVNGFTTSQLYFPDDTLSVIVFTNTDGRSPDPLAENIANAALGLPLLQTLRAPPVVALDDAERDRVIGVYELALRGDDKLTIRFYADSGQLVARADGAGQGPIHLLYYGQHVFGASFDPSLRFTFIVEHGRVTGVIHAQAGHSNTGKRLDGLPPD